MIPSMIMQNLAIQQGMKSQSQEPMMMLVYMEMEKCVISVPAERGQRPLQTGVMLQGMRYSRGMQDVNVLLSMSVLAELGTLSKTIRG